MSCVSVHRRAVCPASWNGNKWLDSANCLMASQFWPETSCVTSSYTVLLYVDPECNWFQFRCCQKDLLTAKICFSLWSQELHKIHTQCLLAHLQYMIRFTLSYGWKEEEILWQSNSLPPTWSISVSLFLLPRILTLPFHSLFVPLYFKQSKQRMFGLTFP